jgi:hypothetical protein
MANVAGSLPLYQLKTTTALILMIATCRHIEEAVFWVVALCGWLIACQDF